MRRYPNRELITHLSLAIIGWLIVQRSRKLMRPLNDE
ncbi:unnamed protein product [Ectocarpus sp. CCAP 1310/34]|nr:unnamed protein product [Ectocarpus sp. CCAP 1310/34]